MVPLKSQAFADRENKQRSSIFLKILFWTLLIAFIGVSVYVFFFSPFLQITNVVVRGTNEVSSGDVTSLIDFQLAGKYIHVVPKNNLVLFSERTAERALLDAHKNIASVAIRKQFPDTLTVSIVERQSLLVWCSSGACFLIDENGIAYAEADFNSLEVTQNHLVKLTDTGNKSVAIGDKVLDGDFLEFVSQIRDALKNATNIDITDEYATPAAVSGEADVVTPGGMQIMFSNTYPLDEAVDNLKLFLSKQTFSGSLEDQFQYIDLRSEDRIFTAPKNPPPTDGSSQTASANTTQQPAPSSDDTKSKKK